MFERMRVASLACLISVFAYLAAMLCSAFSGDLDAYARLQAGKPAVIVLAVLALTPYAWHTARRIGDP